MLAPLTVRSDINTGFNAYVSCGPPGQRRVLAKKFWVGNLRVDKQAGMIAGFYFDAGNLNQGF